MTEYEKDDFTGVIVLNGDGTAELLTPRRPAEDSPEISGWVATRNHNGRVCLPVHNKPYAVKVEYEGVDYVVATGLTNTPTNGKATPIWVRVRAEPEATIPDAPAVEELD